MLFMSFKVIVDSCCDLTPAQLQDPCFVQVPLTIRVGKDVIVDDTSFDQADLLWKMRRCEQAPQTACPSPMQYLEAFDCGAEDLYVVTLSALLSGSHNAAAQARSLWLEDHPNARVHIFNSCSASAGEVLVALKIRELAQSGMDFTTVVSQVSRYINEMETLFVLETLDNLRKNGRLSRIQALVTSTLKIRLLLGSTPEGEICKRGQALSERQALCKMATLMSQDKKHVGRRLAITHCNCLERAFFLKNLVMKQCKFSEVLISETGGISTVYANDGGVVAAY
jgi:DegV family protein with EDD domain